MQKNVKNSSKGKEKEWCTTTCENCKNLESENYDLKKSLARFTNGSNNLNILLGKQTIVLLRPDCDTIHLMLKPLKTLNLFHQANKRNQLYNIFFASMDTIFQNVISKEKVLRIVT